MRDLQEAAPNGDRAHGRRTAHRALYLPERFITRDVGAGEHLRRHWEGTWGLGALAVLDLVLTFAARIGRAFEAPCVLRPRVIALKTLFLEHVPASPRDSPALRTTTPICSLSCASISF